MESGAARRDVTQCRRTSGLGNPWGETKDYINIVKEGTIITDM